jgi:ribose 5-phosphate isomerase A
MTDSSVLHQVAQRALEFVPDNGTIGLGTGHAATAFLHALAEKLRGGFRVRGVPTSQASAELAAQLGIPLTTLDACPELDVDVDGADEVDPDNNLIKGYGGALVREKVVAVAARKLVILVGAEKTVPCLGSRGKLPVEVLPFAKTPCMHALRALGLEPVLRSADDSRPYLTDNGNLIYDCGLGPIERPQELELALRSIAGVVGTGLFLNLKPTVLVGHADCVDVREAS